MTKRIDLHIHTNLSDGKYSPKEIIDEAVKNNVETIAIADHDTIEAYDKNLINYAKEKNINLIYAVEISTKTDKAGIHVLGYNIDINNKELKEKLYSLRNARHIYMHKVAEKLMQLGYTLDIAELDKIDAVTKAHIARNIIGKEENKNILQKEFNHIPNMGEFIETIMNEGCIAYVKKETITPKEAAILIRKAGGIVVLAHPVAYEYEDNLKEEDIKKLIIDMQADGIESNYIYIDRNNHKINEIEKWSNFAKKNNLIQTIGSDFHNKDGIRPEVGLINEDIKITDKDIENILENLSKNT